MTSFRSIWHRVPGLGSGIAAITVGVLLLSLSDALVKLNNEGLSLGQVLTVRSGIAVLCLGAVVRLTTRMNIGLVRVTGWVWLRSLCLALMWGCYYAGLPELSFSIAAACYYTSPMWMAFLSSALLGTRIGRRGCVAILLGLAGVMTILRPGLDEVSPMIGLPLLAGFFYALAAVITQGRCRAVPAMSMAMNLNLVLFLGGLGLIAGLWWSGQGNDAGFLLSVWPALKLADLGLLAGLGVMLAVITALVAYAYQRASAPIIGLFDNGYLVFALFWSILIFGDRPGFIDLLGIVLIGSGALLATTASANRGPDQSEGN
ncbi:DMT family transporter [Roseovarius sp.]|uniref:DMT family transporter n=1 Tax=Roseovarius sp. TaxID=1486281 RepID=UPI003B5A1EC0